MNYAAMAQAIRDVRMEVFRLYAEAGYAPAWSKLLYRAMGMDFPLRDIEELHRLDDLVDQERHNPYAKNRN